MAYDITRSVLLLSLPRDPENIEELIVLNSGLVHKQLNKFGMARDDDARSVAVEALYKAIMTFDASKGFAFSTYATVCIYNGLGCYLRNLKSGIETVSYNILVGTNTSMLSLLGSADTSEGPYFDRVSVINIYRVIITEIARLPSTSHRKILNLWLDSNFTVTQAQLEISSGYSQSYVSRVLAQFKKRLKNKLQED